MPMFLHKIFTSLAVKFVLSPVAMLWRTARRCPAPDMQPLTGPDSAVLTGLASIHLVNLSTMTSKHFFLWVPPLRGPTMLGPQTAKGHVMGIVWRVVGGIWLWFAKSWQPTHRWTKS